MWHANQERLMEKLRGEEQFLVIDSHTMGEPTRIVVNGFPHAPGRTMMEKKQYIDKHYDAYRVMTFCWSRGAIRICSAPSS